MVSNNPLTLTLLFMVHQGVRVCSSAPNKIANIRSSFQKWTFCTRTKLLEISRFHRNLGKFATFWDTLESCKCKRIDAPRLRGPRPPQFCGKYSAGIHSISSYLIGRFLFVFRFFASDRLCSYCEVNELLNLGHCVNLILHMFF